MGKGSRSNKFFNKRKESKFKRTSVGRRGKPPEILYIACEGTTEELYFNDFNQKTTIRINAKSCGCQHETLIDKAVAQIDEGYKEIWCVFDYDVDPLNKQQHNNIQNAFAKAKDQGIKIAFTNDGLRLVTYHINQSNQAG